MEEDGGSRWRLLVLVVLAQLVVQVGFGANGVVLKLFAQGSDVHPLLFSFLRDLCASPALLLVAWVVEGAQGCPGVRGVSCLGRRLAVPSKLGEVLLFAGLGLTGMFLNQFLYIQGVYLTNATIAAIFQPAIPVFTVVLSMALGTEELPSRRAWHGWAKLLGVCCAVAGAVAMVAAAAPQESEGEEVGAAEEELAAWNLMLGNLSLVGNTVGMALYVVLQKRFVFYRSEAEGEREREREKERERESGKACDREVLVRFWQRYATVRVSYGGGEGHSTDASDLATEREGASGGEREGEREGEEERGREVGVEMEEYGRETTADDDDSDADDTGEEREMIGGEGERRSAAVALFHPWAALPLTVTSWAYVSGTVFMGAASCVLLLLQPEAIGGLNSGILFPLFYAVFISSTLCYCLVSWGNKHLSSTVVTAFWPLQIFVAATLGYLLLGERLNLYQAAGGAAILAGLIIVTTAEKFQRDTAARASHSLSSSPSVMAEEATLEVVEWAEADEGGQEPSLLVETVPREPLDGTAPEMRRKTSQ